MNAAALSALALELDVALDETAAQRLIRRRGVDDAEQLVRGGAALVDLASALGQDLDLPRAMLRLVDAGLIYELAADRILEPVRRRKQRVFVSEYNRLETAFFGDEAKARHAVFIGHVTGKPLGYEASMLLRAADDAGLQAPDAAAYRAKIVRAVGGEIERRYPVRREADWQVIDPDSSHPDKVKAAMVEEQRARDLALAKRPELAQRIDALASSSRMRREVRAVLDKIRKRLAGLANQGAWYADPERYAREVIQPAADAARRAS